MNDLAFLQTQLASALQMTPEALDLAKAIQSSAGFVGYNLEPEAALMIPYFAGWRARVPSDKAPMGATQATWKVQLGYGAVSKGIWGSAETATGIATTPSATQFQAPFLQQAVNGDVSYISMLMARGFDDPLNVEVSNVLSLLILLEEYIGLTGNNAALPAPTNIVAQPSTLSAANTFGVGNWRIKVTAITNEGAVNNASANSTRGESVASAAVTVVVPAGDCDFIDVYVPAVPGAVGYKFYIEDAIGSGAYYLVPPSSMRYAKYAAGALDLTALGDAIVVPTGQTFPNGVNHVQITAVGVNTNPAAPTIDHSANALTFEGLLAWTQKTTIYSQSIARPQNVDMQGKPFTTVGTGIVEIDNILESLWNNFQISPSLMIGSAKTIRSLGNAIVNTAQNSTYQIQIGSERGAFQGGIYLGGYTNKVIATMVPGQNPVIPTWAHPYLPDGTLLMPCEDIPQATYKYSRKGKAFSLEVLAPYTYWELARTGISVPFAVLWSETLKCHHPQAQTSIQGIRVDS